jgi:predicted ATPase/DNA-binding winged helix-turn-helix (wHTH) protein
MKPAAEETSEYSFASFRFLTDRQVLLERDAPISIGARARDILVALLEQAGAFVDSAHLMARAWPNKNVDEVNLKFHVSVLRKALGDSPDGSRLIAGDSGQGYRIVVQVRVSARTISGPEPQSNERQFNRLPPPLTRMVGRSDTIAALTAKLTQYRFVSIVGPGGIGKTTVAVAVADGLSKSFEDGVGFAELAPVSDPSLVPSILAASLGLPVRSDNAARSLISALRGKRLLIVLDNCEHLIEAAAAIAEDLFRNAPGVYILATSREPLRAEGERVHRLGPLASPQNFRNIGAAEALAFAAVQLFVERAAAATGAFSVTDENAPYVASICQKLDGVALAIEIVAGRVEAFGVVALAKLLDDKFRLSARGRRTALTRHQTLQTTLDWSFGLLSEFERTTLRRLAIFSGVFTPDAASCVLQSEDASATGILLALEELVAKSLVNVAVDGIALRYRLLDTTRAYARLKLEESGEKPWLSRRHAEYYQSVLSAAYDEWSRKPAAEWLEGHRTLIDNARTALDWALSSAGSPDLAVALTAVAIPLWFQLSLMSECGEMAQRALLAPLESRDPRSDVKLQAALALSLMQTRGSVRETREAWTATLRLAEGLADIDYQLRALWGLWAGLLNSSRLREALATAERFYELAKESADRSDLYVGDRMIGYILHLLGDQDGARPRIEKMIREYITPVAGERIIRYVFDQTATARCFLARILWLQGYPDQATAAVDAALSEATRKGDALTVCQVLVQAACPVAILTGDLNRLGPYVSRLLDESERNALGFWRVWGKCFDGVSRIKSGDVVNGIARLTKGLDELKTIQYGVYYGVFLCEYAEALGRIGQASAGLVAIDEALSRSRQNDENWYVAELLRVKGELMLQIGEAAAAEDCLEDALELARQQRSASWELRAAISLSRLPADRGYGEMAAELLSAAYKKFSEGFGTADLVVAKEFVERIDRSRGYNVPTDESRVEQASEPRSLARLVRAKKIPARDARRPKE